MTGFGSPLLVAMAPPQFPTPLEPPEMPTPAPVEGLGMCTREAAVLEGGVLEAKLHDGGTSSSSDRSPESRRRRASFCIRSIVDASLTPSGDGV